MRIETTTLVNLIYKHAHLQEIQIPQMTRLVKLMSRPGEGRIHYSFEFYEGFSVYALTLPYKLNRHIYLPVTRDSTVFGLARD